MAASWPYHTLLPEVLIDEDEEELKEKQKQLSELDARLLRLEAMPKPTSQLGQVSIFDGLKLDSSTLLFGAVVGLIVYVLVSSYYEDRKPVRQWWQW